MEMQLSAGVVPRTLLAQIAVAEAMNVGLPDLCRSTRGVKRAALARQVAMYLCHHVYAMRVGDVAVAFGRDRTTVRHAIRSIEEAREDPELDRMVGWMEATLCRAGEPHV